MRSAWTGAHFDAEQFRAGLDVELSMALTIPKLT